MRIRAVDVASLFVLAGISAQGAGLWLAFGAGVCLTAMGTEVALLGIVGVLNAR